MAGTWYDKLREEYRPERLRVLLIGESPPDPGERDRRFFYAPALAKEDNLYRGVVKALYEDEGVDIRDKPAVLARLRNEGYWLIDAVDEPINTRTRAQRRRLIRARLSGLITTCVELAPECGAIVCHDLVYQVAAAPAAMSPLQHARSLHWTRYRHGLRPRCCSLQRKAASSTSTTGAAANGGRRSRPQGAISR
jgi:hypothetical protein